MSTVKVLCFSLVFSVTCFGAEEPRAQAIQQQIKALNQVVTEHGGYAAIEKTMTPFYEEVKRVANEETDRGRFTLNGQTFSGAITTSAVDPNWELKQTPPPGMDTPVDVIIDFDRQLKAMGVDLIMVPVPGKVEAYPETFGVPIPAGMPVSTGRIRKMQELLAADVEVLDILPGLLAKKAEQELPVYETSGHHPSGIGARTAAELVHQRLKRYTFDHADPARFKEEKLTATERVDRSVPMTAWKVSYADGSDYSHVDDAQIIVTGDSHAFAFEDASWASHIARLSGIPITDMSTSSGGSTGHIRLAGLGKDHLKQAKVVVWIFTCSNLERFPWRKETVGSDPSIAGLFALGHIQEGLKTYAALRADNPNARPNLSENELNNLGYRELGDKHCENAVALFKINTELYPDSANAYDSLGEALGRCGHREEAIANFKKSLSMAPSEATAQNSIACLKKLGVEYTPPKAPELTAKQMERLVGVYQLEQDMVGKVFVEQNHLKIHVKNRPIMTMEPINEFSFGTDVGARLRFQPSDNGVMALTVSYGGSEIQGRRVEGVEF